MAPSASHPYSSEMTIWADRDDLRTSFTLAMSAMYKAEVPLYGDLVRIVGEVNQSTAGNALDPKVLAMRYGDVEASRLNIERHGAIRLGTAQELRTVRRIFALIGLSAVGYYDLSAAGLPMHATCFRPKTGRSLHKNPFRVFTSVLRPELIKSPRARDLALELLSKRNIFSDNLMRLLDLSDIQGRKLTPEQGRQFVHEAMKTFSWHGTATASQEDYQCLKAEHPVLADIACFRSSHINHLTPRTLDITAAQEMMKTNELMVKDRIEGPPLRVCPILLRQTSFLAIEEPIKFPTTDGSSTESLVQGSHRARFGEIEERGAAVTPAGRRLYDDLLNEAMAAAALAGEESSPEQYDQLIESVFRKYPDDWNELRRRRFIYCTFQLTRRGTRVPLTGSSYKLDRLLEDGVVEAFPMTYEDFLPLSAAGIFQSNLGSSSLSQEAEGTPDYKGLENALGASLTDPDDLYRSVQSESVARCASELGIEITV
ncbi:Fc.00g072160.m01.CDS01 [Cosmosporella sp. VM-42]